MTHGSLLNKDWPDTVERLGGTVALKESARKTKAFLRGREFEDAIAMLRMILAYCLGGGGLRSTAAWAASIGLADVANTHCFTASGRAGIGLPGWWSGRWLARCRRQAMAASSASSMPPRSLRPGLRPRQKTSSGVSTALSISPASASASSSLPMSTAAREWTAYRW